MSDDRLKRAVELVELARHHREVRQAVAAVLRAHDRVSIGHLADQDPEVFDELHEAMTDMVEQLPTRGAEGLLPW